MYSWTLLGCHDLTKKDRALCFFFYLTTTAKLEFTDWSEVQRRFGSGEIAIFQGPWKNLRPFWVPMVAIMDFWGSHRGNYWIKKLIEQKLVGGSKNLELNFFTDPISHFLAPCSHSQFCRHCRWWGSAPFAARLVFLRKIKCHVTYSLQTKTRPRPFTGNRVMCSDNHMKPTTIELT